MATLQRLLPWYDLKRDFGARGDGTTDDTVAVRAAVAQVAFDGGGTIYCPPGTYLIDGSISAGGTTGERGVIQLPQRTGATGSAQMTIRFVGPECAPQVIWNAVLAPSIGAAIFKTTLVDSTHAGADAMFAAAAPSGSLVGAFTALTTIFEGLTFIGYDDPSFSFLNLTSAACCKITNCIFIASFDGGSEPTHTGQFAVKLPKQNNAAMIEMDGNIFAGHYTALYATEHLYCGTISGASNLRMIVFTEGGHASVFSRILDQNNKHGIIFDTEHEVVIGMHDVEHFDTGGWYAGGYSIKDPSNSGYGKINYRTIFADATYPVNGGSNLAITRVGP